MVNLKYKFPCIECGLCCRHVSGVEHLTNFVDCTGKCKFLQKNNLCAIYYNRPLLCNVEKSYDTLFQHNLSEIEFILLNLRVCLKLNHLYGTNVF